MRHGVSTWLVLACFLPATITFAQDTAQLESSAGKQLPSQPSFSEDWPGQDWPQEGTPPEESPRERPMLYYEGFGVMDFNRDGSINQEEYTRAFRNMDTDGDGIINTLEWKVVHGPENEDEP